MTTMYTVTLSASLLITTHVHSLCQWNGEGDDTATDWVSRCGAMDADECGSHGLSRGHDAERCQWVEEVASDGRFQSPNSPNNPDPSEYGCIWDGTGAGDPDRMAMSCDRLTEEECRAAEGGLKDSRCRWRARVHLGWNMENEQEQRAEEQAVKVVDAVSRWVDENPHQIEEEKKAEKKEEHEAAMEEAEQALDSEPAESDEEPESGTAEESSLGFDPPIPPPEEVDDIDIDDGPGTGWWEQPDQDTGYNLPGYPESDGAQNVPDPQPSGSSGSAGSIPSIPSIPSSPSEVERDYSSQFDHPRVDAPPLEAPSGSQFGAQPVFTAPPPDAADSKSYGFNFGVNDPRNGVTGPQPPAASVPQQPSFPQQPSSPQFGQQPASGSSGSTASSGFSFENPQSPSFGAPAGSSSGFPAAVGGAESEHFGHPMDGSSPLLLASDALTAEAQKAGVCLWDGTKCNTGEGVEGVFMGCDSSKMIQRCAKLQGAQCSGDTGKLYACRWEKGGAAAVKLYEAPSVEVVAETARVGVCLWNGMGCNTGEGVEGVFQGCDSSKMMTRCAKLGGAACEGEQGELYRCRWDTTGDRAEVDRNAAAAVTVGNVKVSVLDALFVIALLLTVAVMARQMYHWWIGDAVKEIEEFGAEYQPLMMDLMENRV